MDFHLQSSSAEKILIAAHRGSFGGNIPCNTITSYEIALKQGADIIEVDVEMGGDGKLYIFHPTMEPHHLCSQGRIPDMTTEEIAALRYVNYDDTPTQFGIETFDDVLETFKNRCYINVDKFWGHPVEIYNAIKRHGMTDQMIVKSSLKDNVLSVLEEVAPDVPFLPIVKVEHPAHEMLMRSPIRYVGAEVLFTDESMEVAQPEFLEKMHRDGKLVWVNSIIYDYKKQLSAGHSDDTALCESMDKGWGWLAKHGFDIIQTDWTGMLVQYLREENLLYK